MGVKYHGRIQTASGLAYKIAMPNVHDLESIGWRFVGCGSRYAYMLRPVLQTTTKRKKGTITP